MPSRILALDHGTKRIGVALSDELGWTAQPLETYERRTLDLDIAHIADLVKTHEVGKVLLGLPLRLNGEEGLAVQAVYQFLERLAEALPVPVVTWDERLTTKDAEELLIAAKVGWKERKGVVDRIAAALADTAGVPLTLDISPDTVDALFASGRTDLLTEIGRGLVAYDAEDAAKIVRKSSSDISLILGIEGRAEMVHRDDMVLGGA